MKKEADKMTLKNALETSVWLMVWAAEPKRSIDVRMTYDELKVICDLINKARS